jgi:hypothetical protein
MTPDVTYEQQIAHLSEGNCDCHDSWDQCPCAEAGHFPGCSCCPLGSGLCGPKSADELLRDLAVECWQWDDGEALPGQIPDLLSKINDRVDWLDS